ncbi:MAG: DsbE family thiol:disulfide interchange protein [Parvibaculaceae bacterium]
MSEVAPASTGRRLWTTFLPLLVFAGLAVLFLVRLQDDDPSRIPSVLLNKPAPVTELPPLEGLSKDGVPVPGLKSADFEGHVTLVNVWASWCAPCREEHPQLLALAQEPGVRLVGINYKDNPENARRFLGALGLPFAAVGVDESGRTAIDWGVYGVPETFLVDRKGVIRYKHIGPISATGLEQTLLPKVRAIAAER